MRSGRHEFIDRQRSLCHICGYDMKGQDESAPCPECGTPFDRRPDMPGAEKRSRHGIIYTVLAMLVMPVLIPLTFLFYFLAIRVHYWLKNAPKDARVSYQVRKRHRLMQILMYVWFVEFIAVMWLDTIWPPFMDWW